MGSAEGQVFGVSTKQTVGTLQWKIMQDRSVVSSPRPVNKCDLTATKGTGIQRYENMSEYGGRDMWGWL